MENSFHTTNAVEAPSVLRLVPTTENINYTPTPAKTSKKTTQGFKNFIWTLLGMIALLTGLFLISTAAIPFPKIVNAFPFEVLIILIALDIFSIFVVQTGVLESTGIKLASLTKGRADVAAILMGLLMFASSAILNNLAAIFILAPIFLTLLRAMQASSPTTTAFLSMMLILCNLGGMATPMGDFPAIILMSSGLIGFMPYLTGAFPLAVTLALLVICSYQRLIHHQHALGGTKQDARTRVALEMLSVRHRHVQTDLLRASLCGSVFLMMVLAWAIIPPIEWPFALTAVVGTAAAALIAGPERSRDAIINYDLRTVIFMMVILTFTAFISATGILSTFLSSIIGDFHDPILLLFTLMIFTTLVAGLFSAGPAAAVVLPVFVELSGAELASYGDLLGIAFAASICAGSSMFLHSATAGPTLKGESIKAGLINNNRSAIFNSLSYLFFGLITGFLQLSLSMAWIWGVINLDNPWLLNIIPIVLGLYVTSLIIKGLCSGQGDRKQNSGRFRLNKFFVLMTTCCSALVFYFYINQ